MIFLKPIEKEDNDRLRRWRNDPDIAIRFFSQDFISKEKQEEWFIKTISNPKELNWLIYRSNKFLTEHCVGTIALVNIDLRNRKAEYARLLIDKRYRNNGYAYEAEHEVMKYAFQYLNLNKIYCEAFVDNIEVIQLHHKTGFKDVGVLRNHIFRDGEYRDVLVLELMRAEWLKKNGL